MSSQEQRPIRSRRELRRAREEQEQAQATATTPDAAQPASPPEAPQPAQAEDNGRNRRAADAPLDAVAPATERSSQIRARDRAALRTIKELADKEEQLSGGGPPTRRQLRLQQLQAEVATSANPIVPAPGAKAPEPAAPPDEAKDAPISAVPGAKAAGPTDAQSAADGSEMSVEQALAVRELIAAQVQNQTAKLEHIAEQDPLAVDPEVLAQQIALAERAAVLNKRAAAKQKLAEKAAPEKASGEKTESKAPGTASGPSTANNLAMVTPLEFVKVPGVERPVMKRPSTTFVPVVTSANAKAAPAAGNGRPSRGRAGVLARAEAVARNARKRNAVVVDPGQEAEHPPVSARTAYGLDPLDANTAGLARAQRSRLLQYGVLALGLVALIVGIIMITSG
ncbi:hypothetical protein ACIPY3_06980 [Paenarthrobacter sp. NPDC089714]|uniref:hypothetical protein n=1 Tax=Paenarthrobacter sp. NPDC089714 TaxID=3364377 RepID=UPI003822CBFA